MIIDDNNLDLVFKGFQSVYHDAFNDVRVHADKIAMTVPGVAREATHGWLCQFPQLREWIALRYAHSLQAHSFTTKNRKFESTVSFRAKVKEATDAGYLHGSNRRWGGS